MLNPWYHVCIIARDHGLLEHSKIFRFEPILGRWRSILWGGFHHIAFLRHGSKLAMFFVASMNSIFWDASFVLIKNQATLDPEKLQGFYRTLLYHCYTLSTEYVWVYKWYESGTSVMIRTTVMVWVIYCWQVSEWYDTRSADMIQTAQMIWVTNYLYESLNDTESRATLVHELFNHVHNPL